MRRLLEEGDRFAFFQAIRLLRRLDARAASELPRIRPKLTLGFPDNDIDRIAARPGGGYEITANFFGLYGVASPLPTFYTEDLFEEEREGRRAAREFLDILHQSLYAVLIDSWNKYRLPLRIVEQNDEAALDHLYAFVGLEERALRREAPGHPGKAVLLRYAGLFNQRPRSALGLQTLIAEAFAPATVRIESCPLRVAPIPADQRLRLGEQAHRLGEEAYLGSEIDQYESNLVVHLADLPAGRFHALLPGTAENDRLRFLIDFYLIDPLNVEITLHPRRREVEAARLGFGDWSRLGFDTWLAPPGDGALPPVHLPADLH